MATPQPRGGLGPGPCWSWRIPGPSLKGGRNCGAPEFEPSSLGRFTVFSLLPAFPVLLSPEVPLLFIHFLTLASVIRSPFSPLCPKTSHTRNIDRLCSPVSPSPPPPPRIPFQSDGSKRCSYCIYLQLRPVPPSSTEQVVHTHAENNC